MSQLAIQQRSSGAPRVRASAASGLCAALRQAGAEPDALLERMRLSEQALEEPLSWLDLADYCRVLEKAADRCGTASFGWGLGLAHSTRILGDLAPIVETAPTLAAGLTAAVRSFAVQQEQTVLALECRRGNAVLSYQIRDGRIVHRRQDAELSLGALIGLLRRTLGPQWCPQEIHLEHATCGGRTLPESLQGTPVYLAQRTNAIVLSGTTLGTIMPAADACWHGTLVRQAHGQLRERRDDDFIGAVLQHIRDTLADGHPGIAPVARRLGLSGPALYRRLSARGVEYSDLQRDLRRELALAQLADREMPLTEIALLLGYSELSAFSRAFRLLERPVTSGVPAPSSRLVRTI